MEVPVSDILEGSVNINYYSSEIVVYPSTSMIYGVVKILVSTSLTTLSI